MKHALNYIYIAVAILMTIFIGLVVLSAFEIPRGFRTFVVQSGSMVPEIKTGSVVFVKSQIDYSVNDVVTYRLNPEADLKNPRATITHRIVEITESEGGTQYITKGDANQSADRDPALKELVLGKVVFTIPYVGYPVGYAKTQTGFVILIVIPATILIYSEILSMRDEIKKLIERNRQKAFTSSIVDEKK